MTTKYTYEELKSGFERREFNYVHSLSGVHRHELMFEPFHISPTEYRLLSYLYFNGDEAEPSVIADALHILRSTMTKLLDSLEKRGFCFT